MLCTHWYRLEYRLKRNTLISFVVKLFRCASIFSINFRLPSVKFVRKCFRKMMIKSRINQSNSNLIIVVVKWIRKNGLSTHHDIKFFVASRVSNLMIVTKIKQIFCQRNYVRNEHHFKGNQSINNQCGFMQNWYFYHFDFFLMNHK